MCGGLEPFSVVRVLDYRSGVGRECTTLRIERSADSTVISRGDTYAGTDSTSEFMTSNDILDTMLQGGERFPQVRLQLKGCQRCGGDVTSGRDWDGDYVRCLQCGWYKDAPGDAVSELADSVVARLMEEMEMPRAS